MQLFPERLFVLEYCESSWVIDGRNMKIHSLLGLLQALEELPITIRLKAISDVGNGLTYLHHRGLIAGDLKLSNVLVHTVDFNLYNFPSGHNNVILTLN